MKLLFLDFDGVCNSAADGFSRALSRDAAVHLNAIVARTGAHVVVSSSWRCGTPVSRLRRTLQSIGFTGRVIGKTPEFASLKGDLRGHEIQEWLDGYPKRHLVEAFAILDDDEDMGHLAHRLVRTDARVGITGDDVEKVIALLGGART